MTAEEILPAVRALPPAQRVELGHAILDGAAADEPPRPPRLTDAQRAELERRIAEADANPDDVIPWETVRTEAEGRSRRSLPLVFRRAARREFL